MVREPLTDPFHQVELLVEVDGTDLQFHATEALCQLLLQALEHLLVTAHPHQSVDGDAHLTATEGGVEEAVAALEVTQGGLESEEHRGVVAQRLGIELSGLTEGLTELSQALLIEGLREGVAAQVGQWCTFAHAVFRTVLEVHEPDGPGGINPA